MKNYLGKLGLRRKASSADLSYAVENAIDKTGDAQSLKDAQIILENATTQTHYDRVHLQYEAINAAIHCLTTPDAQDSHRWSERLVEFNLDPKNQIDP